jgi:hypothetical protein
MTIDVDIPPSLKKRSEVYKNAYDEPNPVGEGFPIVSGLFKTSRAIDTSRHTMETNIDPNSNAIVSITKRSQMPVTQAVSVVSQKLSTKNRYHPSKIETVNDIATFQQNQDIATVSQNKSVTPSKRKQQKNPFGGTPIYDTTYREMTEEILSEMESSGKYDIAKAPRKPSESPRKALKDEDMAWITEMKIPHQASFERHRQEMLKIWDLLKNPNHKNLLTYHLFLKPKQKQNKA